MSGVTFPANIERDMQVSCIFAGAGVRSADLAPLSPKARATVSASEQWVSFPSETSAISKIMSSGTISKIMSNGTMGKIISNGTIGRVMSIKTTMSKATTIDSFDDQRHLVTISGLSKRGKPLGLHLQCRSKSHTLRVREVYGGGAVAEWNKTATDCQRVRKDDLIVSVNGISGDEEEMRRIICEASDLSLVISRRDADDDEFQTVTV